MATQTAPTRTRRGKMPGQMRLLAASAMIIVGAFLPWLYTPVGTITGMRGPGLWTATVGVLALAGALVPVRVLAILQAAAAAVLCVAIPVWQFVHVFSKVGMGGWLPGPGLVLTLAGGVLAGVAEHGEQDLLLVPHRLAQVLQLRAGGVHHHVLPRGRHVHRGATGAAGDHVGGAGGAQGRASPRLLARAVAARSRPGREPDVDQCRIQMLSHV